MIGLKPLVRRMAPAAATLVIAVGMAVVPLKPAAAHHDGWGDGDGERGNGNWNNDWQDEGGWHGGGGGYWGPSYYYAPPPPPAYYAPAPSYYYPAPRTYYAPPAFNLQFAIPLGNDD
jgi:hypothetical protein